MLFRSNPLKVSDEIKVMIPESLLTQTDVQWVVSDMSGRILSQGNQTVDQTLTLTLPSQTLSGAYLLTIIVDGKRYPFKLIVQN